MASSTAQELYRAGQLQGAIQAATEAVRQAPTDTSTRGLLCELLCFAGEFDRADRQLDALSHQDSSLAVGVSLLRQLVRAEQARQQFYNEGRLPELLGPPSPSISLHLQASICVRENKLEEAERILAEAQA